MIRVALKLFVVEYSMSINSASVRTLDNVLRDNIKKVRRGVPKDDLPIFLCRSREEADRYLDWFNKTIVPQAALARTGNDWQQIASCLDQALDHALSLRSSELQKIGIPQK